MEKVSPRNTVEHALQISGRPMTAIELGGYGLSNVTLQRLVDAGVIERVTRGIYALPSQMEDPRALWAAISLRSPEVVFCLESAATFHGLTQNMGAKLHIALPMGKKQPSSLTGDVDANYYTWRQTSFEAGIENYDIAGVQVRITSPARTVVDMYRYSSIAPSMGGIQRCIDTETLHDCISRYLSKAGSAKAARDLRPVAKELHVWKKLKPFLEIIQFSASAI